MHLVAGVQSFVEHAFTYRAIPDFSSLCHLVLSKASLKTYDMKTLLSFAIMIVSLSCFAQGADKIPGKGVGFWVIESNVSTPREAEIFFYNHNQELVYKEKISGRRLNVKRKKVVRKLDLVLQESVAAWSKEKILRQDLNLVWAKL